MEIKDEREMVKLLKALANPLRLRILFSICDEPKSAYAISRELNKPYPLIHLYLTSLKKLGLIKEVKVEKRVESLPPVRYYMVENFRIVISPDVIKRLFKRRGNG